MKNSVDHKVIQDYGRVLNELRAFVRQQDELVQAESVISAAARECVENNQFMLEYWQSRATSLTETMKALDKEVCSKLFISNNALADQVKQSFLSLNLNPSTIAKDYLYGTSLENSQNEALRSDWQKVGDHLAHSMNHYQNG